MTQLRVIQQRIRDKVTRDKGTEKQGETHALLATWVITAHTQK